jgi:hypothetical protein
MVSEEIEKKTGIPIRHLAGLLAFPRQNAITISTIVPDLIMELGKALDRVAELEKAGDVKSVSTSDRPRKKYRVEIKISYPDQYGGGGESHSRTELYDTPEEAAQAGVLLAAYGRAGERDKRAAFHPPKLVAVKVDEKGLEVY